MGGFESVHASTEKRLRACGVTDSMVVQGRGTAPASAGTHVAVGSHGGRRFGHCIDLSFSFKPSRRHFDLLVSQGFAPFLRFWHGKEHWHIIDATGLPEDDGSRPDHLDKVNSQLRDWTHGRNGLAKPGPLPVAWAPTPEQRELIRSTWLAHTDWGRLRDEPDEWAEEPWRWCKENGLLDGTRPRDQITRQEFAVVLHRFRMLIRKADYHAHADETSPAA